MNYRQTSLPCFVSSDVALQITIFVLSIGMSLEPEKLVPGIPVNLFLFLLILHLLFKPPVTQL